MPDFIRNILEPMNRQNGDRLPSALFWVWKTGHSRQHRRLGAFGIAMQVPVWQPEGCTQCNQCAFICPHAAIRPALLEASEEREVAPAALLSKPAQGPNTMNIIWLSPRSTALAAAAPWIFARRKVKPWRCNPSTASAR